MPNAKRGGRSEAIAGSGGVRERLLDAALAILRESGLRRLTQVQVAERAGVRQSHLTYYFPTREDLLAAVTERAVQGIARHVGHAVGRGGGGDGPPLERLAAAIADVEHMRAFVGMIVEADSDPTLRAFLAGGAQQLEAAIAAALGGGDGVEERARLVLIALWGLGLHRFALRPPPKSDPTRPYLSWVAATAAAAEPPRERAKARRRRDTTTRE